MVSVAAMASSGVRAFSTSSLLSRITSGSSLGHPSEILRPCFEERDQAAGADHFQKEFGRRIALQRLAGGQVFEGAAFDVDTEPVAGLDERVDAGGFQKRHADLVSVAIEGAGEKLTDDGADAGCFE